MRINHIMAALRENLDEALRENLDEVTRKRQTSTHADLGKKRMIANEKDVQMMVTCLEEWVPKLWDKGK